MSKPLSFTGNDIWNTVKPAVVDERPLMMDEYKAEAKPVRKTAFSHFTSRTPMTLSQEPVYNTKFSRDGSLLACSFQDGSVKIMGTQFNQVLY